MATSLTLPAPAKLNLFLHVTGRRDDGYHLLQTLFQFVDIADELIFTLRDDAKIVLTGDLSGVLPEQNLIYRAASALHQETQCCAGVEIHCRKRIPTGAGMGGGSSDAATTLLGLNQLWQCGLTKARLLSIGLQLGADVPIFVHGHSAWAEGVGEALVDMQPPELYYVLIKPPVSVSTAKIFTHPGLTRDTSAIKIAAYSLEATRNDLQNTVCALYPEVQAAINWLSQFGVARMTGSGSVVFAPFQSKDEAQRIAEKATKNYHAIVCKGCNLSPLQAELATFQV